MKDDTRDSAKAILFRNSWLLAGRMVGALLAAAFLVLAAQQIRPTAFGRLAVLLGIATFLGVLAEGGLPLLVLERVAAAPSHSRRCIRQALWLRTLLVIPSIAGVVVLAVVLDIGISVGLLYGVAMVGSLVQTTIGAALKALGQILPEAFAEVLGRAVTLGVGAALLLVSPTPKSVAAAYAVGALAAIVPVAIGAGRLLPPSNPERFAPLSLRRAVGLGTNAILVTVYNRIDLWLLAMFATPVAVGLYAAVYRFYEGLVLPGIATGGVLAAAATGARTPGERSHVFRTFIGAALALTTAAALTMALTAESMVRLLFGPEYAEAVPAMRILCLAAIPAAILSAISPVTSLRDRRATVDLIVIGIAVSVGLNLLLIPFLAQNGAATAMVVSQSIVLALVGRRAWAHFRTLGVP